MNTTKYYQPDQHSADCRIPQDMADALFRNGFEDTSWRNDISASFTLHEADQCLRGLDRSRFFTGIADAMADQWGNLQERKCTRSTTPARISSFTQHPAWPRQ